jgi:MFS transporter, SHS family, lactate transporter
MAIGFLEQARGLNKEQRSAFVASFLGWSMDAFDYLLIVFVFTEIAHDLNTSLIKVQFATTMTLAARPVGRCCSGCSPTATAGGCR